jgi:hypothetical protein
MNEQLTCGEVIEGISIHIDPRKNNDFIDLPENRHSEFAF